MCLQGGRGSRFLALRGGFHGDSFAAMSLGDPEIGRHDVFAAALPRQVFAPLPPAGAALPDDDPAVLAWAQATEELAARHAGELAGIVAEPVLQSARGMRLFAPGCLRALRRIATRLRIPLVVDEVASGFGRLGTMFGHQLAGVIPDIVCLGKALTGGYLSLGAVLCTDDVAAAVDAGPAGALLHGPTYTGNPLACAVAVANLDLLASGAWRDDVRRLEAGLRAGLAGLRAEPHVRDVEVLGGFAAVRTTAQLDLDAAVDAAVDAGVWLRPFRDVVYAMPPYTCTSDDTERVTAAMAAAARAGIR
jgi:adenosylmethionine-8-amino-7-oxononanoate aminotransferase